MKQMTPPCVTMKIIVTFFSVFADRPRRTSISISGTDKVKVGDNIQLTCTYDAYPSPHTYSWYRYRYNNNNKQADSSWWQSKSAYSNTLNFNVERSDEACYMCNVTNSIGTGDDSDDKCIYVLCE